VQPLFVQPDTAACEERVFPKAREAGRTEAGDRDQKLQLGYIIPSVVTNLDEVLEKNEGEYVGDIRGEVRAFWCGASGVGSSRSERSLFRPH
jgi:hypothetical protein